MAKTDAPQSDSGWPYKNSRPDLDTSLLNESHVKAYRETNGETGYIWNGAPILLVTTKGRKSGQARTIPIIFTPHGDGWAIIASNGGAPTNPAWFLNLEAHPEAEVQVKGDRWLARSRVAPPGEREQIWAESLKVWPSYDIYQTRTERKIPIAILEPVRKLAPGEDCPIK